MFESVKLFKEIRHPWILNTIKDDTSQLPINSSKEENIHTRAHSQETYRDKILNCTCVKGMEHNVKDKQNPVWQFLIMYKIRDISVVECPNLIANPQNLNC